MWLETTLTIANGQSASPELNLAAVFPAAKLDLTIIAPGSLPETVTLQVARAAGGTYGAQLHRDGTDVTISAGKATPVAVLTGSLKLVAGGNVGGDRVFTVQAAPSR